MKGASLYDLLGVPPSASAEEIRSAYRKLVLVRHPDHGGTPESFQQLQYAYDTLSDAAARRAYDRGLGVSGSWRSDGGWASRSATATAPWRRYLSSWFLAISALPVLSGKERRHADFVVAAGLAALLVTFVLVVLLLKATHGLILALALGVAAALWYQRRARTHALDTEKQGIVAPNGRSVATQEPPEAPSASR